jgi:hypothetical protein
VSDPLLSPEDVRRGLEDLVTELVDQGVTTHIHVVGGAAVMIQAGRQALSRDIDALYPPLPAIDQAIRAVAGAHHWPDTWLNDAVKMYASHYDADADWEVHLTKAGVTVSVATCRLLLAMKLLAARPRDAEDIALLIAACGITDRQGAIEVFDAYYPTEALKPRALAILDDLLPITDPTGGDD